MGSGSASYGVQMGSVSCEKQRVSENAFCEKQRGNVFCVPMKVSGNVSVDLKMEISFGVLQIAMVKAFAEIQMTIENVSCE